MTYDEHTGQIVQGWEIIGIDRKDNRQKKYYLIRCTKCGTEKVMRYDWIFNDKVNHPCKECTLRSYIGLKFGRLTVIDIDRERTDNKNHSTYVKAKCQCENILESVKLSSLLQGDTKSCGCIVYDMYNAKGHSNTRIYQIYSHMKSRCYNKNNPEYDIYGGKGITISAEWLNNFESFYNWSMNNGYTDDLTIDRIDNNKGYSKDNCRWATMKIQGMNRTTNRSVVIAKTNCNIKGYFKALIEGLEYTDNNDLHGKNAAFYNLQKYKQYNYNGYTMKDYKDNIYNLVGGNPLFLISPAIFHESKQLIRPAKFLDSGELINPANFF